MVSIFSFLSPREVDVSLSDYGQNDDVVSITTVSMEAAFADEFRRF